MDIFNLCFCLFWLTLTYIFFHNFSFVYLFFSLSENLPPKNPGRIKQSQLPLLREVPAAAAACTPIATRPALAQDVTETVLNYSITWGNMRDTLLASLEKQERPTPSDRENMVFVISKEVKEA